MAESRKYVLTLFHPDARPQVSKAEVQAYSAKDAVYQHQIELIRRYAPADRPNIVNVEPYEPAVLPEDVKAREFPT